VDGVVVFSSQAQRGRYALKASKTVSSSSPPHTDHVLHLDCKFWPLWPSLSGQASTNNLGRSQWVIRFRCRPGVNSEVCHCGNATVACHCGIVAPKSNSLSSGAHPSARQDWSFDALRSPPVGSGHTCLPLYAREPLRSKGNKFPRVGSSTRYLSQNGYGMNAFIYLSLRFTKYLDEVFMKANILHLETLGLCCKHNCCA
jgi:hypothetical protein